MFFAKIFPTFITFLSICVAIESIVYASEVPCECASILCEFGSNCGYMEDGSVGCLPLQSVCYGVECPENHLCFPEPKNCLTEPCPQHTCVDVTQPCIVSGCNDELCGEEEMFSPCIFQPEFACIQTHGECRRGTTGECDWQYDENALNLYNMCIDSLEQ